MINGPGNVWVERGGELEAHRGTGAHRRRALPCGHPHRPPARARSRDPAHPRRAARRRLAGRHMHAAREPPRGHDDPPVWGPRVLRRGPRRPGRPARDGVLRGARRAPVPPEHSGLRRHRLGEDHAAQRPDRAAPRGGAHRRHRGHARAQDRARRTACASRQERRVPRRPSRSATWCGTRSATGPTTSSSARCGAARPPICCRR